jgi:hypothetical protein
LPELAMAAATPRRNGFFADGDEGVAATLDFSSRRDSLRRVV